MCIALNPSSAGSASTGWYSSPSPALVTAKEKCPDSILRTAYTIGWPPLFVHHPPGRSSVRPLGVFLTRSTTSPIHPRNLWSSLDPAGHPRARSPRPTSACLASASAADSRSLTGVISWPNARPTSVADRTRGRSAPSADPVARATRRRSTASRVSIASAIRSTNAGVSQTAPGRVRMEGPPRGPTRPARSSAPMNRRWFVASPRGSFGSFGSCGAAPALLVTTPAPAPPGAAWRTSVMASESAATQACIVAGDSASSTNADLLSPGLGWNTNTRRPANARRSRPWSSRDASVSRTRTCELVRTLASPRGAAP